ncbi:MAG: nucleoside deaminase, partial [Bacilli bacterium]|nr:nucleoside deaminase [Bacilli bacterium]
MMNDLDFLKLAFKEAKKAYVQDEVPVGALIVINGEIIAKAHNKKESLKDPTLHAEIEVIKKACKVLGRKILDDATIYI